jgi:hypothetical protein
LARVEAERLETPKTPGGQAVAATLVARKHRLVDHGDSSIVAGQGDGCRDPCGSSANDHDIWMHPGDDSGISAIPPLSPGKHRKM